MPLPFHMNCGKLVKCDECYTYEQGVNVDTIHLDSVTTTMITTPGGITFEVTPLGPGDIKLQVQGKEYSVAVNAEALKSWLTGEHNIQDVFPILSASEREYLMTGLTPAEWDAMWGGGED